MNAKCDNCGKALNGEAVEGFTVTCPACVDTPKRYQWTMRGVHFDFYRLTESLNLKSQPQIHAIKKLIRAGQSIKPIEQDIDEAISALNRWKEMIQEDRF